MAAVTYGTTRGDAFGLARQFIDRLRATRTNRELHQLMEDICRALGFCYFALIHHCDLREESTGVININNYPPVWERYFIECQLYRTDPVVHACHRTCAGFLWSDLSRFMHLNQRHREILRGGANEGLSRGFTIPCGVIGERHGSCSFAGPRNDIQLERGFVVGQLIGAFSFEAARRLANGTAGTLPSRPQLSPRQRDCAVLAGRGLKDLAIAGVLGLSYKSVVNYLSAARERYGVHSREQLVIHAVLDGDICLAELDTRKRRAAKTEVRH